MKVKELRDSLRIWSLASLDFGVKGLTFNDDAVYFDGSHSGARFRFAEPPIQGMDGDPLMMNGRTLMSTVSLLDDDDDVQMVLNGDKVVFETRKARAIVNTSVGGKFLRETTDGPTLTVDRAKFRVAAMFAASVASRVMTNPVMTGVHIKNSKGRAILRAVDAGGRAGITWVPAKGDDIETVIPAGDLLASLPCFEADEVDIVQGGVVCLRSGAFEVMISALHGQFPDLSSLPRDHPYTVEVPTSALELMARAAATFDTDRLATIRFRKGRTVIAAHGEELGEFQSVVEGKSNAPEDFTLTFDATLLAITSALGRKVKLNFRDKSTPVMMVGEDGGKVYWLSPVQIA